VLLDDSANRVSVITCNCSYVVHSCSISLSLGSRLQENR
jgi:hypothetical protein